MCPLSKEQSILSRGTIQNAYFSELCPFFDLEYAHFISVDGFLFLMIGTALYNQLVDLRDCIPCMSFKTEELQVVTGSGHHSNIQHSDFTDDETDDTSRLLRD